MHNTPMSGARASPSLLDLPDARSLFDEWIRSFILLYFENQVRCFCGSLWDGMV